MGHRAKLWIVLLGTFVPSIAVFFLPPIPQSEEYHRFADHRTFLGIPNCLNVVSNAPFLVVGILGLTFAVAKHRGKTDRLRPAERWSYILFFLGVALTTFGSSYYHWQPSDAHLFWDRLPITTAFMSFLAAMISERVGQRLGALLLVPLMVLGGASVVLWDLTQASGRGDLRLYADVQFGGMLAILLIAILLPSPYTHANDIFVVLGLYLAAKVSELFDQPVYSLGRAVSGHTVKHLLAAAAAWWILRTIKLRRQASVV
jgi:hypothetical protein